MVASAGANASRIVIQQMREEVERLAMQYFDIADYRYIDEKGVSKDITPEERAALTAAGFPMDDFKTLSGAALTNALNEEERLIKLWLGSPDKTAANDSGIVSVLERKRLDGTITPAETQQLQQAKLISSAYQKKYGHVYSADYHYLNELRGIFSKWETNPPSDAALNSITKICQTMLGADFRLGGQGEGAFKRIERKMLDMEHDISKGINASKDIRSNHINDVIYRAFKQPIDAFNSSPIGKFFGHPFVRKITSPFANAVVWVNNTLDKTLRLGPFTKIRQLINIAETWFNPNSARHKMVTNIAKGGEGKLNKLTRDMVSQARDLNKEFNNLMSLDEVKVVSAFMEFNNLTRFSLGRATPANMPSSRKSFNHYMQRAYGNGGKNELTDFFYDIERIKARNALFGFEKARNSGANTFYAHGFFNQMAWYSFDRLNREMAMITALFQSTEKDALQYLDDQARQNASLNTFFGNTVAFYSKLMAYNTGVLPQLLNPVNFYDPIPVDIMRRRINDSYNIDSSHVVMDNLARDVLRLSENLEGPEYDEFRAIHMNNGLSNALDKFASNVPIVTPLANLALNVAKITPFVGNRVQNLQEIKAAKYGVINEYWGGNQLMHTLARLDSAYKLLGDGHPDKVRAFTDQLASLTSMLSISINSLSKQEHYGISSKLRRLLVNNGKLELKEGVNSWADVLAAIDKKLDGMREALRQYSPDLKRDDIGPGTSLAFMNKLFAPTHGHVRLADMRAFAEVDGNGNLIYKPLEGYIAKIDEDEFYRSGRVVPKLLSNDDGYAEPVIEHVRWTAEQVEAYHKKYFASTPATENMPTLHPALQPSPATLRPRSDGSASFADTSVDPNFRPYHGYAMVLSVNGQAYLNYRDAVAAMKAADNPKIDVAHDAYGQPIIAYCHYTPQDMQAIYEAINSHLANFLEERYELGKKTVGSASSAVNSARQALSVPKNVLQELLVQQGYTTNPEEAKNSGMKLMKSLPSTVIKGNPEPTTTASAWDPLSGKIIAYPSVPAMKSLALNNSPDKASDIVEHNRRYIHSITGYDYKHSKEIKPTELVKLIYGLDERNNPAGASSPSVPLSAEEQKLAKALEKSPLAELAVKEIKRLKVEGFSVDEIVTLAETGYITMPGYAPSEKSSLTKKIKYDHNTLTPEQRRQHYDNGVKLINDVMVMRNRLHEEGEDPFRAHGRTLDVGTIIRKAKRHGLNY